MKIDPLIHYRYGEVVQDYIFTVTKVIVFLSIATFRSNHNEFYLSCSSTEYDGHTKTQILVDSWVLINDDSIRASVIDDTDFIWGRK